MHTGKIDIDNVGEDDEEDDLSKSNNGKNDDSDSVNH